MDGFSWANTLLTGLMVVTAMLMTLLILVQEGKGGGLAALGGTKAAGVEGVSNPVRRATGYLAAVFFLLAIGLGILNRAEKPSFEAEETKPETTTSSTTTPGLPVPPVTTQQPVVIPPPTPVKVEAPKTEAPKTEAPKTEEKKADTKAPETKTETPKAEEKKADAPKTEEKKPDAEKK